MSVNLSIGCQFNVTGYLLPVSKMMQCSKCTVSKYPAEIYQITVSRSQRHSPIGDQWDQWSFPVTVGFTILAIRTVLLSAIVLFIRVISCDIVYI